MKNYKKTREYIDLKRRYKVGYWKVIISVTILFFGAPYYLLVVDKRPSADWYPVLGVTFVWLFIWWAIDYYGDEDRDKDDDGWFNQNHVGHPSDHGCGF